MPKPIGDDRLEILPNGGLELHSPIDKGWKARRDKTHTTAEFPGTPVRWEDTWYEVVHLRRLPDGRRIYVLAPWQERHPIRNPVRYDRESERALHAEVTRRQERAKSTHGILIAGLVLGHIPAHAQREIESEYGVSAARLSLVSLALPMVYTMWVAVRLSGMIVSGGPRVPILEILFAAYMAFESVLRSNLILSKSAPCGSILGLIAYDIWRLTTTRGRDFETRAAPVAEERLGARSLGAADAATTERDAYQMRVPYLALLSPNEQLHLRTVFGFDPKAWGMRTAFVIGVFAALGVWSSALAILKGASTFSVWSSLLVAGFLLVEQVRRVIVVNAGKPAGSLLGAVVRPWCRRLLMAKPVALKHGSTEAAPVHMPDVWDGDAPDDQMGR